MNDPYEALYSVFMGRYCVECSSPPELYTFNGGFVSICSTCTARRLGEFEDRLPFDLLYLEYRASNCSEQRARRDREPMSADLDCLFKCRRCERMFEKTKSGSTSVGPMAGWPLCVSCWSLENVL